MLGIDLLFVWICYLKLIGKSIFVFGNNYNLDARLKVQLTPIFFFFAYLNLLILLITTAKKLSL